MANVDHFHSLVNGGTLKRRGEHEFINGKGGGAVCRGEEIGSVRASPKFIRGTRMDTRGERVFPRESRQPPSSPAYRGLISFLVAAV